MFYVVRAALALIPVVSLCFFVFFFLNHPLNLVLRDANRKLACIIETACTRYNSLLYFSSTFRTFNLLGNNGFNTSRYRSLCLFPNISFIISPIPEAGFEPAYFLIHSQAPHSNMGCSGFCTNKRHPTCPHSLC